jgi:Zn-dependent protease with chaperone function
MLSLEIIGVLGALFGLLLYGMVRSQLRTREVEATLLAKKSTAGAEKAR